MPVQSSCYISWTPFPRPLSRLRVNQVDGLTGVSTGNQVRCGVLGREALIAGVDLVSHGVVLEMEEEVPFQS